MAIGIDPKDDTGYYNRGLAYLAKGEYDSAVADFETVISIAPDSLARYARQELERVHRAKEDSESEQ